MRLLSLKLTDFISHKSSEIAFKERQNLLIDGKSGQGKSALCEALVWALYGVGRLDNRSLIRYGQKQAKVVLSVQSDGSTFQVRRSITSKGKHDLEVVEISPSGKEIPVKTAGIRETQEFIERELVGSSYQLFINSVVHLQDGQESFVRQNARKRKDLLMELAKSQNMDILYGKVRDRLTEIKSEIQANGGQLEVYAIVVEKSKALADRYGSLKSELADAERDAKTLEAEVLARHALGETVSQLEVRIGEIEKILDDYMSSITKTSELASSISKSLSDMPDDSARIAELKSRSEGLSEDRDARDRLLAMKEKADLWHVSQAKIEAMAPRDEGLQARIDEINMQLFRLLSRKIDDCPETGKPCALIRAEQDMRSSELTERLKLEQGRLAEYESGMRELAEKKAALGDVPPFSQDGLKRLSDLSKTIAEKESVLIELSKVQEGKERAKLKEELYRAEAKMAELSQAHLKHLEEHKTLSERHAELREQYAKSEHVIREHSDASERLSKLRIDFSMAEDAKVELSEGKKAVDALKEKNATLEYQAECLELLKGAFSPTGITAMVLDHVLPRLESRINDILGRLSDFRVKLDTQKENVSGDKLIEGLFISILNERDEEFDFDGYSGGERLKVTVAISEALAEMQKSEFRVLDELFIGLDEESTERFAEIMVELNDRFEQLICISHLRSIKDMMPEKVYVIKKNGISKLNFKKHG
jgi:DNA repair exonuclease SbcCD ATPase subunit